MVNTLLCEETEARLNLEYAANAFPWLSQEMSCQTVVKMQMSESAPRPM